MRKTSNTKWKTKVTKNEKHKKKIDHKKTKNEKRKMK